MTKLTMPEPAAYVRFADNGNIRLWSKSAYEGEEFMKPLYTAEALRDVLEQAREGEAVANSAILARGRFHAFKGENGEPDDWEWFEEGTNCEHGCIDAVIVRADAITAPQPAQPSEPAQPVAQPNIQNQIVKDISRHEPCHTCAHYQQGKLPGVRIHDETCYECRSYWGNKWEAA